MNFRSSRFSSVICLALFLVMGLGLSAAPFSRWSEYRSPNGAAVRILGVGDEFSAYFEAEDGHSVVYDASVQAYVYATKDETGGLVSTGVCVGDETAADRILLATIPLHLRDTSEAEQQRRDRLIEECERRSGINQRWRALKDEFERRRILKSSGRRLMAALPLKREVVGLTLLVDFPMTNAQGKVTNYLSQVTHPDVNVTNISQLVNGKDCPLWGNASSVREYFEDVSCGKLSYTNIVIGWIKLKHPREYYDGGTNDNGRQGRLLIGDALDGFKEMQEYKSKYEPLLQRLTYSDENFRALNVFYAGECPPNSRWNLGLWPHQNDLSTNEYNKIIVEVDGKGRHFYWRRDVL